MEGAKWRVGPPFKRGGEGGGGGRFGHCRALHGRAFWGRRSSPAWLVRRLVESSPTCELLHSLGMAGCHVGSQPGPAQASGSGRPGRCVAAVSGPACPLSNATCPSVAQRPAAPQAHDVLASAASQAFIRHLASRAAGEVFTGNASNMPHMKADRLEIPQTFRAWPGTVKAYLTVVGPGGRAGQPLRDFWDRVGSKA